MLIAERILAHTPPWAFLILAYILWQGLASLRPRTLPFRRILIIPALFVILGVYRIITSPGSGFAGLLPWVIALIISAPIAFVTGPRLLAVDRESGEVTRPGSAVPLVRNLFVFSLQFAVAAMTGLGARGSHEAALAGHVISGATAGYFAGWMIVALRHYRSAPHTV